MPQIVRISFVEGDVRIQRGEPGGKTGATWEKAVADLPLETGFSLATGQGRAEIELEDASTLYLGENSVLTFNDLHETAGIPYTIWDCWQARCRCTSIPTWRGEVHSAHALDRPGGALPRQDYARVESFTDAVSITPLAGADMRLAGLPREPDAVGRSFTWVDGEAD